MPLRRDRWIQSEVVMARDAYVNGDFAKQIDSSAPIILYSVLQQVKSNASLKEQRSRMIELAALLMIEVEQIDKKEGRK
jgi:hypothetical protein